MARRTKTHRVLGFSIMLASHVLFAVLIYGLASALLDKPALPSLSDLWNLDVSAFVHTMSRHLPKTLYRWLLVFLSGSTVGVLGGLLLGLFPRMHRAFSPEIDFLRSLPATALLMFFMAALGDNELSRSLPAFYITVWTIVYYVSKSTAIIERCRIDHLTDLGAKWFFTARHAAIYEVLPAIMVGLRQAVSLSFLVLVSVELIVGPSGGVGVGQILYDWKFYTHYEEIILALVVLGCVGLVLNRLMLAAHRYLVFWQEWAE